MSGDSQPKWSRRKDARPGEIVEAALALFAGQGFAATKLSEVAKQAGVAKGTLYLYFDTKEALFRAAVRHAIADSLAAIERGAAGGEVALAELVPALLGQVAARLPDSRVPAILRMVIADGRAFPDLAAIWHDEVVARVLGLLTGMIAAAQARGEVRPGDPRLHALSIVGPMVTGMLYNDVFAGRDPEGLDMAALADQHARTILAGLAMAQTPELG